MQLKWRKILIADERYESAAVFDVNNDGCPDIVSGAYWYEGPEFKLRHKIGDVMAVGEYFDDFSTIPIDINGNGRLDFVTGGMWGKNLRWRENPGDDGEWPEHVIAHTGGVETTRAWDVDGDGHLELVPNTPDDPLVVYKRVTDESGRGRGEFKAFPIYGEQQGHGLGFGDINGNGRGDFVLCNGWLEAPEDPYTGEWVFHPDFDLGDTSVPILVEDVNGNGRNDLIVGQAHHYGLDWWESTIEPDGTRRWVRHPIDPYNSQYHDIQWADIDGDGEMELVTGKRYRAHNGRDPGSADELGIYYFKWNGESFSKQIINYGPPRVGTGCGILFALAEVNGNGRLDLVAPGKDGLYLFENLGI